MEIEKKVKAKKQLIVWDASLGGQRMHQKGFYTSPQEENMCWTDLLEQANRLERHREDREHKRSGGI